MAHVKLDTLIKDFVVNVPQGLPAHTVRKVIEYKTVKWTPYHMIIKKYKNFIHILFFFLFLVGCQSRNRQP